MVGGRIFVKGVHELGRKGMGGGLRWRGVARGGISIKNFIKLPCQTNSGSSIAVCLPEPLLLYSRDACKTQPDPRRHARRLCRPDMRGTACFRAGNGSDPDEFSVWEDVGNPTGGG